MGEEMKKVLFTATVDSHILHFHIPYLRMFKEKGYEVHVATSEDGEIPYCDVKHKVSFERSPIKVNNLKAIKQLKKVINEEEYDIIHCHTPMGSVVTRIAAIGARKNGTRVIYTAHGFHFYKGAPILNWLLYYPVEKFLSRYTDTLITINSEDYDMARKKFKTKEIKLVHGVGVDKSRFDFTMTLEQKKAYRESVGVNENDFVVIQIGELNENKNQLMSINAVKKLVQEKPSIRLLLVGTGKSEDFYKEKIAEFGLNNNVFELGYRKDIPQLLKISDVCISTSKREGLPVNVIEAQMAGIPVIATNCRGNRDIVCKENLVKIDDVNALVEKMKNYNANIYNVGKYELEKVKEEMEKIYGERDV